jgi:hypothetical protein
VIAERCRTIAGKTWRFLARSMALDRRERSRDLAELSTVISWSVT